VTTIVSYGYTGAIEPNVPFATWQMVVGQRGYWCKDSGDCKPTGLSTGTYQVQIAPGWLGAHGVADNVTEAEVVPLTPPSSGRLYYLIVLHRDWSASTSTFQALPGGNSLPSSLPSRTTGPGVADDQPIALVSLAAGDTVPTITYDLRMWGGNERLNCFDMPVNFLSFNQFSGNRIRFTSGFTYEWVLNPSTLNGYWDVDPEIVRSGPNLGNGLSIGPIGPGWSGPGSVETRGKRSGNKMEILFQARRIGTTLTFSDSQGNVDGGDSTVFTVGNTSWQPPYSIPLDIVYYSSSGASYGGSGQYNPNGTVVIQSGAPGTNIGKTSSGISFRAQANWTREPSA